MGQYYRALLISDDGRINIGDPCDFDKGVKLMEHSWIGNFFVDAVAERLYEQPMRLAWIGDYATQMYDSSYEFGGGYIKSYKEFLPFYRMVWDEEDGTKRITKKDVRRLVATPYAFIINETKGCFIDIGKYIRANTENSEWCIHPLPLLTSIGNGLGGGDFGTVGTESVGIENVGAWAFDRISTSNLRPRNIEEVEYRFSEVEQEETFLF